MKTAKRRAKRTTNRPTKKNGKGKEGDAPATKVIGPVDFEQVRKEIAILVGGAAVSIARKAIAAAEDGELAPVKYLFEAVGLYPPTAETMAKPEDSLARRLLKRLGLPTDAVTGEEEATSDLFVDQMRLATDEPEVDELPSRGIPHI
ncbi:MAG: hypothetical protein WB919_19585 [Candidatus Sulfotelmatobacter sp.]